MCRESCTVCHKKINWDDRKPMHAFYSTRISRQDAFIS